MPSILRAHLDEAVGEVADLGLARGVLDHRLALGERGRHQRDVGGADRDLGEDDRGRPSGPSWARGDDIAAVDLDLGAELLQRHRGSRSTGRVPMAQPPGSDTRASPMRASSGPITQKLARMRRHQLVGRGGVDDVARPRGGCVCAECLRCWPARLPCDRDVDAVVAEDALQHARRRRGAARSRASACRRSAGWRSSAAGRRSWRRRSGWCR